MAEVQELELPLSQIEVDPENVRSEYDADILTGLKSALQTEGSYINPPTVYQIGPKRYRVKHGSTRVLAAQGVAKKIRVRLVEPPRDESSKLLSQMGENLLQGSLRAVDIGRALRRLRDADGRERSLAQIVGALKAFGIERTRQWVSMHLALTELAPEVQTLVNQGSVPGELAYQLRSLPPEEQVAWARRIREEGVSLAALRHALGGASDGDGIASPAEFVQRDLANRLAEVAAESGTERRRGAMPDAEHRHGTVASRWELLPVRVEESNGRKARGLATAEWTKKASEVQRQLAHEALFMGGYSAQRAMQLVDRAMEEARGASEDVMMALNALRGLLDHPAQLDQDSALAEFMLMRMNGVMQNLGRP